MPGYATAVRLEPRGGGARRVYVLWDDAVVIMTGPETPPARDPLVTALFGPAGGASRAAAPGPAPPRRMRAGT